MKALDKYLQRVRISKAEAHLSQQAVVLDIGSVDGVMFEALKHKISHGFGIDPTLKEKVETPLYTLIPGYFPEVCPPEQRFDAITLLAVLEHIPIEAQTNLARACHAFLKPKGKVIITVPSPQVDFILDVLGKLKLIDGMSLEEHYGFRPETTVKIFEPHLFKLIRHSRFQFGLNNLFVFEKIDPNQ